MSEIHVICFVYEVNFHESVYLHKSSTKIQNGSFTTRLNPTYSSMNISTLSLACGKVRINPHIRNIDHK